jgi:hypothetical protein
MKILYTLLASLLLSSCVTTTQSVVKPPSVTPKYTVYLKGTPAWHDMQDVQKDLGSKVKITGNTVDLMGGKLSGRKLKRPSNSQDENSIGVKIHIDNFVLKNGVLEDVSGGFISFAKNVTFENLTILKVGEDAISSMKDVSPGMSIINCKIYGNAASDKLIQGNDGNSMLVKDTKLFNAITGIRVQKKDARLSQSQSLITGNTFTNIDTAINASGKATVTVKDNTFNNVREKYKTDSSDVKFVEK